MADVLTSVQRDLDARINELRPLAEEYERLLSARDALAGVAAKPSAERARPARASRNGRTARRRPSTGGKTRRDEL